MLTVVASDLDGLAHRSCVAPMAVPTRRRYHWSLLFHRSGSRSAVAPRSGVRTRVLGSGRHWDKSVGATATRGFVESVMKNCIRLDDGRRLEREQ